MKRRDGNEPYQILLASLPPMADGLWRVAAKLEVVILPLFCAARANPTLSNDRLLPTKNPTILLQKSIHRMQKNMYEPKNTLSEIKY